MTFNLQLSKPAQDVIFSRKVVKISHLSFNFDRVPVSHTPCQEDLSLFLDEKLSFNHYIDLKISKASKRIGIIKIL